MLTRNALQESWRQAKDYIARAPVDGMLAHLIAMAELERGTWDREAVEMVAVAYAIAIQKNGGRG